MIQLIVGLLLLFQFSLGLYRLRWGVGFFIFIFIVVPDEIPFFNEFHGMGYIKSAILVAFINIILYYIKYNVNIFSILKEYKNYFIPICAFTVLVLPSYIIAQNTKTIGLGLEALFLNTIVKEFLPGIIVLLSLKSKKDFIFYIKCIALAVLIMGIYDLYEFLMSRNPFVEWLKAINKHLIIEFEIEDRFSFSRRMQSTTWHPIAYGGYLSMIIILLSTQIVKIIITKKKLHIYFYLLLLLFANLFLTASRAPWVSTFVALLIIFFSNINQLVNNKTLLYFILIIFFIPTTITLGYDFFALILDKSVGGSSMEMRQEQFEIVLNFVKDSIYIGFGNGSIDFLLQNDILTKALGFESIIFIYYINSGILGLVGLFILYYSSYYNLVHSEKSYYSSFFIAILTSHLIFVIVSGEIRTLRLFFMIYSLLYYAHKREIYQKKLFSKLFKKQI